VASAACRRGVFKTRGDGLQSFPLLGYRRFQFSDCRFLLAFVSPSRAGFSMTVTKVNGKEIKSLADLAEAVKQPIEGFIKIETEEDPKQIELDAAQVAAEAPILQENYGISSLRRLD
jgi:hypothetical protein